MALEKYIISNSIFCLLSNSADPCNPELIACLCVFTIDCISLHLTLKYMDNCDREKQNNNN